MRRVFQLSLVLLLAGLAYLLFGCTPPQQQVVVVTATPPSVAQAPMSVQPDYTPGDAVEARPPNDGNGRLFPNPGFQPQLRPMTPVAEGPPGLNPGRYPPKPLPVLPSNDGPPPGVYVDPSLRGNGPPPQPYATYPVRLAGYIQNGSGGDYVYLHAIEINGANSDLIVSIYDPGRILQGWGNPGIIEVGAVEIHEGANFIACMAIPFGSVNPDGSSIQPRFYTDGPCEMG